MTTSNLTRTTILLALAFALAPLAVAQGGTYEDGIYAQEVELETDPFTGEESCTHFIAEPDDDGGFLFALMPEINEHGPFVTLGYTVGRRDLIYDEYVIPEDDRVLMRIGDDIHRLPASATTYNEHGMEVVVVQPSYDFMHALAHAREPIPVRLESDYSGLQYDYTIPMRMLRFYRDGFARICLNEQSQP